MTPYRIVSFDKGRNNTFGLCKASEPVMPDAFSFDGADDTFSNGIALRIADVGIGKFKAKPPRIIYEKMGGILASVIKFQFDTGDDAFSRVPNRLIVAISTASRAALAVPSFATLWPMISRS